MCSLWLHFLIAHQRRYRYIYCGIPTGECRQNNNERAANGRPFFDNVAVSTADLITPHPSPKVTPSPQAPQGEDNGLRRETQHRTCVTRNNTVSAAPSTPGYRKVQRCTCVTRGSHGFVGNFDTGRPESSAPHLRYARQPWFPPQPRHRDTAICVSVGALNRL